MDKQIKGATARKSYRRPQRCHTFTFTERERKAAWTALETGYNNRRSTAEDESWTHSELMNDKNELTQLTAAVIQGLRDIQSMLSDADALIVFHAACGMGPFDYMSYIE
jgi:hypothetical protein